jgi:hypothetical protein
VKILFVLMLMILEAMGTGCGQTGHAVACSIQTAVLRVETLWKYRLSVQSLKSTSLMDCIAWAHETVHIDG